MEKDYMIISLDSTDDFEELASQEHPGDGLMVVSEPLTFSEAGKRYFALRKKISNVYLVKILNQDITI